MGLRTSISWCDSSWNPFIGCKKLSPGCQQCYMFRDQERYGNDPKLIRRAKSATFNAPLKWKDPAKVFTCSWSDFFIEEADDWRDEAWDVISRTPHLSYQILTKRPENILSRLPENWGSGWPNVWLGVSVETQEYTRMIEFLTQIDAAVRFISYEPALGPVDFTWHMPGISWIIAGGESGYHPRYSDLNWFRSVRNQCKEYKVAYFHKQNGGSHKINGVWGGDELDGERHHDFPVP